MLRRRSTQKKKGSIVIIATVTSTCPVCLLTTSCSAVRSSIFTTQLGTGNISTQPGTWPVFLQASSLMLKRACSGQVWNRPRSRAFRARRAHGVQRAVSNLRAAVFLMRISGYQEDLKLKELAGSAISGTKEDCERIGPAAGSCGTALEWQLLEPLEILVITADGPQRFLSAVNSDLYPTEGGKGAFTEE